ncbi:SDR family NAD(P)-dependent oxidoreductase [Chloroflexota bacterium]
MRLEERVAIVTGSTRGIGKAIARRFVEEGASVVLNGRDRNRLEDAAEELRAIGGTVLAVQADVTRSDDVKRLIDKTIKEFKKIDILVNNVGGDDPDLPATRDKEPITRQRLVEETSDDFWDAVVNLNLKSMFSCANLVAPYMKEQRSGKIINIASGVARQGSARSSAAYVSAKAGVTGFTRQLCRELAPFGINCNTIAPGMIMTEILAQRMASLSEDQNAATAAIPMGRIGRPEEIASVAAFLASDDASYVNGAIIDVNGGRFLAP